LIKSADHFQFIPDGILAGFEKFKKLNFINCEIVEKFSPELVLRGEAYLFFTDRDLIAFIKEVNKQGLTLGSDIGLISYDDTPMKEVLEGGITVISTDFEQMGKTAGKFITDKIKEKIANPSKLIIRKSL
jgi:DNA-binding LacI/PurR family transcriptional regulator